MDLISELLTESSRHIDDNIENDIESDVENDVKNQKNFNYLSCFIILYDRIFNFHFVNIYKKTVHINK